MFRIDKQNQKLIRLKTSPISTSDHWERDLQGMICKDPDPFCEEINESLWVIGQEVRPSAAIADRIDILAIDDSGAAVVIELKRGTNKLQLLQAVSYAGMISKWSPDKFIETLSINYNHSLDEARSDIESHTGSNANLLNSHQRILLIAEDFDPALLIAAEWLNEKYGVDIRCYRLQLSHENDADYLTCECVYPPIEIASLTRDRSGSDSDVKNSWVTWDEALSNVENNDLKNFFRLELAQSQESRLQYRQLIYRLNGKRRFWLTTRSEYGYVEQQGRFEGDETYWKTRLSRPQTVGFRQEGRSLRFQLATLNDFEIFRKAIRTDLQAVQFSTGADPDNLSHSD